MSMDTTEIGKIIKGNRGRDAIHIAVAPLVAAHALSPGDHIGLSDDGQAVRCATPIGIVDPYLEEGVKAGEKFYMFLYPNTITSLRHEWIHPSFKDSDPIVALMDGLSGERARARREIEEFAKHANSGFDEIMESAREFQKSGDRHYLSFDIPDELYQGVEEFWKNFEIITGIKAKSTESFFSCGC
jgi:hypothetical protein